MFSPMFGGRVRSRSCFPIGISGTFSERAVWSEIGSLVIDCPKQLKSREGRHDESANAKTSFDIAVNGLYGSQLRLCHANLESVT